MGDIFEAVVAIADDLGEPDWTIQHNQTGIVQKEIINLYVHLEENYQKD